MSGKKAEPSEEHKKFAARLRAIRKQRGFNNYEKFANEIDFPRSQYGRYEKGQDIKLSTIILLLGKMGVTLTEFFNEDY